MGHESQRNKCRCFRNIIEDRSTKYHLLLVFQNVDFRFFVYDYFLCDRFFLPATHAVYPRSALFTGDPYSLPATRDPRPAIRDPRGLHNLVDTAVILFSQNGILNSRFSYLVGQVYKKLKNSRVLIMPRKCVKSHLCLNG